jgi:hypothetical protein
MHFRYSRARLSAHNVDKSDDMERVFRGVHARNLLWLSICFCIGAALSLKLGQDAFWDTKNYHLYNAWALLHDRNTHDIAAASMQSYFNPLPDVLYFELGTGPLSHWPRVLAALQGWSFGALLYVTVLIAFRLAKLQRRKACAADVLASLIGVSGTMAVSQAGSTTHEIALAVFVLLGFYVVMPLFDQLRTSDSYHRVLIAGVCCGVATGIKPTAIVYLPALGVALLTRPGPFLENAKLAAAFGLAAGTAIIASYGWWGFHLYLQSGNPLFPLFNQVFRSDLIPAIGNIDDHYRPRNLAQWLFYPFFWIAKNQHLVVEPTFSDPRYALAMLAMFVILARTGITKLIGDRAENKKKSPILRLLVVFVAISYVCWLNLFSILRYAIPIEALTGLLMSAAIQTFVRGRLQDTTPTKRLNVVLGGLFVLTIAATHYPNWGRVPFGKQVFAIHTGKIESGSLVFMGGIPSAYLAPFFPKAAESQFIGLNWFTQASKGFGQWNAITLSTKEHRGPIYVVLRDNDESDLAMLGELLDVHRLSNCTYIESNLDFDKRSNRPLGGLKLCRVYQQ